jgi:hypothetical protein
MEATKASVPRHWVEVRHPVTNRLAFKYCPATHEAAIVDRGQREIVKLPQAKK